MTTAIGGYQLLEAARQLCVMKGMFTSMTLQQSYNIKVHSVV